MLTWIWFSVNSLLAWDLQPHICFQPLHYNNPHAQAVHQINPDPGWCSNTKKTSLFLAPRSMGNRAISIFHNWKRLVVQTTLENRNSDEKSVFARMCVTELGINWCEMRQLYMKNALCCGRTGHYVFICFHKCSGLRQTKCLYWSQVTSWRSPTCAYKQFEDIFRTWGWVNLLAQLDQKPSRGSNGYTEQAHRCICYQFCATSNVLQINMDVILLDNSSFSH